MANLRYETFHDDTDKIQSDAVLLRRILPKFVQWDRVGGDDKPIIPSQGFQDYSALVAREQFGLPGACMSVAVEEILNQFGYDANKIIEDHPGYGVAAISAGAMRTLEGASGADWSQGVMLDPNDDEPWHAVVYCQNGGKKTGGMQTAIRATARWMVVPTQTSDSAA